MKIELKIYLFCHSCLFFKLCPKIKKLLIFYRENYLFCPSSIYRKIIVHSHENSAPSWSPLDQFQSQITLYEHYKPVTQPFKNKLFTDSIVLTFHILFLIFQCLSWNFFSCNFIFFVITFHVLLLFFTSAFQPNN